MNVYDTDTIEVDGLRVSVTYYADYDYGPPWEECDGHGPVRRDSNRHCAGDSSKHPGERPMNKPDWRQDQYYYDWQAACKLARKDGWNAEPYDAPNRIERAVQADFEFLSAWVESDWCYVGVEVALGDETESVWGVETWKDHHETVAKELAQELVAAHKQRLADIDAAYAAL